MKLYKKSFLFSAETVTFVLSFSLFFVFAIASYWINIFMSFHSEYLFLSPIFLSPIGLFIILYLSIIKLSYIDTKYFFTSGIYRIILASVLIILGLIMNMIFDLLAVDIYVLIYGLLFVFVILDRIIVFQIKKLSISAVLNLYLFTASALLIPVFGLSNTFALIYGLLGISYLYIYEIYVLIRKINL